MPIGSDARYPLNTDPSIVPAQPAVSVVNPGYNPRAQPQVPLSSMPQTPQVPIGQVATQPQPGAGSTNFWDVLRNLFAGPRGMPAFSGPPQGMTGLLLRGRGAPGTNQLGNPLGRY